MKLDKKKFSEWYHAVLEQSEMVDNRFKTKGTLVWRPFGFNLQKRVFGKLREISDKTGHQETLFPLLTPEDYLAKEAQHIKGFEDEVFWVTHGGKTKLDVKLALRPTSETIIYPMFKLWIRSHADLPLKIYQIVNTFRYETKHTRPLIRDREISFFYEAHCVHVDNEDAEEEMTLMKGVVKEFFDALGVPYLIVRRPEWDKFPGAEYTIAFDQVLSDGKTLQSCSLHNLGTSFSKTFEIEYEDEKGKQQFPYITCHGISGRAIAGMIAAHGDDHGLVLPPEFAPTQIVIVPIVFKDQEEEVLAYAKKVAKELSAYRVEIDDSEDSPGSKYFKWEMRGVPLRIEVGPKEIEKNECLLVRRDTRDKQSVSLKNLKVEADDLFEKIATNLRDRAWKLQESQIHVVNSMVDAKKQEKNGGVIKLRVCSEKCAKKLEDGMDKMEFRGILIDEKIDGGKCAVCKKKAKHWGILSNAY